MSKNCKYDLAWDFSEGLAKVVKDNKYGFIDTSGREVIPCIYDDAWDFHEGMAKVQLKGKRGYIDKTGREVIPCNYHETSHFSDGWARVELDGKTVYFDKTGCEILTVCHKDFGLGDFHEGMARIFRGVPNGFIDKTGKEVIHLPEYFYAADFCEGLATVTEGIITLADPETDEEDSICETFGFIDKTGREITPCKYGGANDFHDGLALVVLDGKRGFIDKSGVEVIPLQYDYAHDFQDGLAQVAIGNDCFFIDKSGKKVFSFSEHGILAAWDFSEGLAAAVIEVGGKRGYIDKTGRVVIPCKYDQANDFHDGLARVYIGDKGYFIDKTGRELDITFYSDEVGKQKIIWPPKDEELPF